MITSDMAQKEIETGLAAVCAWCEHYHSGRRNGVISCNKIECGGPRVGRSYPEYKGVMKDRMASFCFICGKDAEAGVLLEGRLIGVCKNMGPGHKTCYDRFEEMLRRPDRDVVVNEVVVPAVGGGENGG